MELNHDELLPCKECGSPATIVIEAHYVWAQCIRKGCRKRGLAYNTNAKNRALQTQITRIIREWNEHQ